MAASLCQTALTQQAPVQRSARRAVRLALMVLYPLYKQPKQRSELEAFLRYLAGLCCSLCLKANLAELPCDTR